MAIKEALQHFQEGKQSGKATCTTTCLYALLPENCDPSTESIEALRYNASYEDGPFVEYFSYIYIYEMLQAGFYCQTLLSKAGQLPSTALQQTKHIIHSSNYWKFAGAIIDSKILDNFLDIVEISHVIAVTNIHKNRKATIIDSNIEPPKNRDTAIKRKVPFSRLDRKINPDSQLPTMATWIATSLDRAIELDSQPKTFPQYILKTGKMTYGNSL